MPGLQQRGDVRGGAFDPNAFFTKPAGDRAPNGDLIDPDSRKPTEVRGRVELSPSQPEKPSPTNAELIAQEEKSIEVQAALKIRELNMALTDALTLVHNAQIAKIGGKNSHSDLMVRNFVSNVVNKLGKEQRKQNTDELQGQTAKLGEELKKLGPAMEEFWKHQVSINRLDLPN